MKLLFSMTALCLFLTACGSDKKSSHDTTPPNAPNKPFELTPIQYPAAIVFEGGMGQDMWERKDVHPIWRLYICMNATETPITGAIHVDLTRLGQPSPVNKVTRKYPDGRIEEIFYTFSDFYINYQYKSFLMDHPDMPYGYAWGEAEGVVNGKFNYNVPDYSFGTTFKIEFRRGTLGASSSHVFDTATKQKTYITSWIERFTASKADKRNSPITPCENENKPYFFQMGDQIPK